MFKKAIHTIFFAAGSIFFLTGIFCISPSICLAQTNTASTERILYAETIHTHLARRVYVTGEVLWFKLYVQVGPRQLPSPLSKVAYVELLDDHYRPVLQSKIAIDNSTGKGSWLLPATLSGGQYLLRAYTKWIKDNKTPIAAAYVSIINPEKNAGAHLKKTISNPVTPLAKRTGLNIDGLAGHFQPREKISFTLENNDHPLQDISIAVYKMDSLEPDPVDCFEKSLAKAGTEEWAHNRPIPEYSGHLISGRLLDRSTGKPASGIRTLLTVPGDRFHFGNCVSDSNGRLVFDVKRIAGTENIILQYPNTQPGSYRFEIDHPFLDPEKSDSITYAFMPLEWKKQVEERVTASQLQAAFYNRKKESFFLPGFNDSSAFFGKPDKTYLLDDYTRFASMEEVLREYVSEIQVRKIEGNFRLRMLNIPYKLYFDENPLVLVDGVPVFDMNKVIALDPLKVRKLDILARKFYLGSLAFNGIAAFSTYNGDLGNLTLDSSVVIMDYPGLQLERQFNMPDYSDSMTKEDRKADLRNLLYWNPDIQLQKGRKENLSFYASDLEGDFIMVIQGINQEGVPVFQTKKFSIRKQ